jgi:hypothetical protein
MALNYGQLISAPSGTRVGGVKAGSGIDITPDGTISLAAPTLSLVSPGSISGNAQVGATLTYVTGSATGGTAPYNYSWIWKKASDNSTLQVNGSTYVISGALVGDRVYVALTATDAVSATATGNTSSYPASPSTIISAGFPNIPPSLSGGPVSIPQVVSGTWADGTSTITSTGCIQISTDGVSFTQGPLTPSNGTTVYLQWDPTGGSCGGAPQGTVITGTLTNGTYTNSYSLTLDRTPAAFTIPTISGQALNSTAASSVITLSATNAPTYITYTAGSPNTLTALTVSINSGTPVAVPTSGTTVSAPPGATLQFAGTVGNSSNTTYSATINTGSNSTGWSVTTAAVAASITTPSITSPANGSTNLNPALNSPAGIPLLGSTYSPLNGAGAQTSSTWEVYRAVTYTATTTVTNVNSSTTPANWSATGNASASGSTLFYGGSSAFASVAISSPVGAGTTISVVSGTLNSNTRVQINEAATGTLAYTILDTTPGLAVTIGLACNVFAYVDSFATSGPISVSVPGFFATSASTVVTLTVDNTSGWLSNVSNGSVVTGSGGQSMTVSSVNVGAGTITSTSNGSSGTWTNGTVISVNAPAPTTPPTTNPPGPGYTAITGSPFSVTSAPFTTQLVPQSSLATSSTYFSRVQYATTNSQPATSNFSAWSSFGTASVFSPPAPGAAYAGGYLAGQYTDGGVLYNLIVAPKEFGETTGLAYNTTNAVDFPIGVFNDQTYGKPASDLANDSTHPIFQYARGLSINGYSDWYVPALGELQLLLANLRPAGVPANGPAPYFNTGGSQQILGAPGYWSSTQDGGGGGSGFALYCDNSNAPQNQAKSTPGTYIRAVRRQPA